MKLSSDVVGESNDENNFPYKLLLTNTQVSMLHEGFANGSPANIKLSKSHLSKIEQSGGFLGRFLGPLVLAKQLQVKRKNKTEDFLEYY